MTGRSIVFRIGMVLALGASFQSMVSAQSREEKVRDDRARVEKEGFWIYNNLPKAFEEAKETGKPIIVVLRCIPCEECVKLDDELVDTDPVIRPLLEQFVCARQVSTNGLDLNLFQFDTDQSFAVFFLNADGTIYGRFGTRSHRTEWRSDVSLKGLAAALQGALELHADYPNNKEILAGKSGTPLEVSSPEEFPTLKDRYTDRLSNDSNIVKSCIHCHQIGDARRDFYRNSGEAIPPRLLDPFPHPKVIGLILDPHTPATVETVADESPASEARIQVGDRIVTMNRQPILSMADVQWVLDQTAPEGGTVALEVDRDGAKVPTELKLDSGWRQKGDLTWRVSSWGLRRMVTGGMLLKPASEEERASLKVEDGKMALKVDHVGQYGDHATAKKAGFLKGDFVVSIDGRDDLMTENDLFRYGVTEKRAGDRVKMKIVRGDQTKTMTLPMQK
ncbi:Trx7/PDZ domain-containing (seleno)protein [Thalassoglobus sp. JC818]|uniref:Trx7/PDZ domain-containing (seleno)protein n=1 Tax=Thalassoglobus sp. JC818 TaxID=3232136 RepID=UPI003459B86B